MNVSPSEFKNILLLRTDRIGDVVLSLPMLPVLKDHFPDARISIMVRHYTKELVQFHSCVDEVLLWEANGERSLMEYVQVLRSKKFDAVILPYPRFKLALIAFLARIPVRVGTGYRWYSFLFSRKVYEHRKDAKRHEVEYNINLLAALGIESSTVPEFEFFIPDETKQKIDGILAQEKVGKFVVLHAGSGGSARDWPLENFAMLGDAIHSALDLKVLLTGSESEKSLVADVAKIMQSKPVNVAGEFSLQELGALFCRASAFVSNSTGPLHIAAAMGTPVVAFYPPIVQCSAVRWGPYTKKKRIFTGDNTTCALCKGGPCRSNVCMNQITVEQVLTAIRELINENQ